MLNDGQRWQILLSTDYTFIIDYQSGIVIKRKYNTSSKVGIRVLFVVYITLYGYFS